MVTRYTALMSSYQATPANQSAPQPPYVSVGSTYRDVLDPERKVVPENASGLSRVYFQRQYVGKTVIPPKLFDPSKCDVARFGFLPVPELFEQVHQPLRSDHAGDSSHGHGDEFEEAPAASGVG